MAEESVYRAIRKNQPGKPSIDDISIKTGIPKDTLGDIERGSKQPMLSDLVELSKAYDSKRLCRWFCSNECPVGQHIELIKVDGLEEEQLGLIMLSIIDSLNSLKKIDLERLVEISRDGIIDMTEVEDFNNLKKNLKKIARAYGSLMRWEEDGNTIGGPVPEPLDD